MGHSTGSNPLPRRNPTVLLRAIPSVLQQQLRGRRRHDRVAIPPYCSGQFQGSLGGAGGCRVKRVAIQPYCSGQFQACYSSCANNAVFFCLYPTVLLRAIPRDAELAKVWWVATESQSHRTAQGNSKVVDCESKTHGPFSPSQSHRTDQGNSKAPKRQRPGSAKPTSQSHRPAQGDSKAVFTATAVKGPSDVCRNPTVLLRAILSGTTS